MALVGWLYRAWVLRNRITTTICRIKCESVGKGTEFRGSAIVIGGKAAVGKGISVGDNCRIYEHCQLVTDHFDPRCGIRIGNNCHFNFGCYLSGTGGLEIGDNCLFGPGAKIITGGHRFDDLDTDIVAQGLSTAPVAIRDNVWVGAGAIILPNVTIGSGSVIAAGAVVTKSVPENSVVAGVPAKLIKKRGAGTRVTSCTLLPNYAQSQMEG